MEFDPSVRKWLLISLGVFSVGLAVIGIFVPLLPTTPFLLLAAACFVRSSHRLYTWLMTHRWLGPPIRNYREHRAVSRQAKIGIMILLWGTIGYTASGVVAFWPVRIFLLLVAVGVTVHVLSMRTLTREMMSGSPRVEKGMALGDAGGVRGRCGGCSGMEKPGEKTAGTSFSGSSSLSRRSGEGF